MKKGKKVKVYTVNNIPYGRDSRGKNKMILAFQPLKIIEVGPDADYLLVKPKGRGNYRKYLIRTKLLTFEREV